MTKFQDGPAKGKTLMLKRAPLFLRVVEKGGEFDALDQLKDTPAPDEKLTAYVLTKKTGLVHINMGRKGGGWYPMAEYKLASVQPYDATMRAADKWRAWCLARPECGQPLQ